MKAGSFLHEKAAEGISAPSIEETTGHSAPEPHLEHSAGPTGPRTPADAELLETSSLGETQPLSLHSGLLMASSESHLSPLMEDDIRCSATWLPRALCSQ